MFYKIFFEVEPSFFSQSLIVVFWTNCAFPLMLKMNWHIFNVRKTTIYFFNISETLLEYQENKYISGIFWAFKSKLQIIHGATYITLFLPDSNNCFYMFNAIYPYLSLLSFHFVFLSSPSFSFSSRHETHSKICNVWFDFFTTCP